MVLRVIGWVLLGLLGLLVLLLVAPVTAYLRYEDGVFSVKLRVLFVKLGLLPAQKPKTEHKRKRRKAKKQTDANGEKEDKEKPKKTLEELLLLVKRISSAASVGVRWMFKGIWFHDVRLFLPVGGEDAAAVAIACGRMQALIGGVRGVLMNLVHLRCRRLEVQPDFLPDSGLKLSFSCKVTASPIVLLVAGILAFVRFLRYKPVAYSKADYLRAHPKLAKKLRAERKAGKTGAGQ